MATVIVRYQGTIEIDCSNRAAKTWEEDGEVSDALQKQIDKAKDELTKVIESTSLVTVEDVDLEVEEANPDD